MVFNRFVEFFVYFIPIFIENLVKFNDAGGWLVGFRVSMIHMVSFVRFLAPATNARYQQITHCWCAFEATTRTSILKLLILLCFLKTKLFPFCATESIERERGKNGTVLFFCVFCRSVKHIFVLQSIIIIIIDTDHYFYILVCAVCACVVQVNIFRYFCLWFIVIKWAY